MQYFFLFIYRSRALKDNSYTFVMTLHLNIHKAVLVVFTIIPLMYRISVDYHFETESRVWYCPQIRNSIPSPNYKFNTLSAKLVCDEEAVNPSTVVPQLAMVKLRGRECNVFITGPNLIGNEFFWKITIPSSGPYKVTVSFMKNNEIIAQFTSSKITAISYKETRREELLVTQVCMV